VRSPPREPMARIRTHFLFFPFPSIGSSISIASLSLSARGPVGGENDILVASRLPNFASRCLSRICFRVVLSSLS